VYHPDAYIDNDTDVSESNNHDFIEIQNARQFIVRAKKIEKFTKFFLFFIWIPTRRWEIDKCR